MIQGGAKEDDLDKNRYLGCLGAATKRDEHSSWVVTVTEDDQTEHDQGTAWKLVKNSEGLYNIVCQGGQTPDESDKERVLGIDEKECQLVVHTSKEKAGEWDLVLKETSAVDKCK